jgi:hypothetical protein
MAVIQRGLFARPGMSGPHFAIFSENLEDLFHTYGQATRYNIYRSWRKGNNGQNEAAAITVFNNSNQK